MTATDPYRCEGCGQVNRPEMMIQRPCPTKDCTQVLCPRCGHEWGSWGPVLCKHCGDMNWWERQVYRVEVWWFDLRFALRARVRNWGEGRQ